MSRSLHGALCSIVLALTALACTSCGTADIPPVSPTAVARPVTFSRDIASIVFTHCAACHRPRGAGPFPLLTFDDVRRRTSQIATVTHSGFMPPWLPEPGYGDFVGQRRLSLEQIELFRQWAEQGALEGDPADLPASPTWSEGWQLGEPDLVLTLPEPYVLPADGADDFRNFVLPIPVSSPRYVRAVELHPGRKQVVHHAIVMVDSQGGASQLDAQDAEPGYEGMDSIYGHAPDGHFLGWTPGKAADAGEGDLPWRLDPGTDLVLQLHMLPSGKAERIQPSVGLFFGERPRRPDRTVTLYLKADLDIPAGASDYEATERFVLPVDGWVERVYPHAHYLGKSIDAFATLPDGSTRWLIRIDDWDFNWQDSYRYAEPVLLPAGSAITMRWTYDNSASNPRNPNDPPRRVVSGNRTTDEMAHLYLQLRVRDDRDAQLLAIADARHRLERSPDDYLLHTALAGSLQVVGQYDQALRHGLRALELEPDHAPAHFCVALVYELQGQLEKAIVQYERAVALQPENPLMRTSLAEVLVKQGRLAEAEAQIQEVLKLGAQIGDAHIVLGTIRRLQGAFPEAIEQYERALALQAQDVRPHAFLAAIRTQQGDFGEAIAQLEQALAIDPKNAVLHNALGRVFLATGATQPAIEHFRQALAIDPDYAEARQHLTEAEQNQSTR